MPWNYRKYGSAYGPVHQSHLNSIVGDYGCPKRFRYEMDAAADRGDSSPDERDTVAGKAAVGTAVHETIARALTNADACAAILAGSWQPSRDTVKRVFFEEYEREVGGRTVQWYGSGEHEVLDDAVHMIVGLLSRLHERVARVLLVEPGFITQSGGYWLSGHMDLVYVPKHALDRIAFADWKTGSQKPSQLELDHSWQAGVYSSALRFGTFLPRETIEISKAPSGAHVAKVGRHVSTHASRYIAERQALEAALVGLATGDDPHPGAVRFDAFPSSIHHVALHDYVPYERAGKKSVTRTEDLAHYGYERPPAGKHVYKAGDLRGGAWCAVQLRETDLARLEARLRNVVGMIRMGRFVDQIGDMRCGRCRHARECLNDGYANADESRALAQMFRGADMSDTQALSADE